MKTEITKAIHLAGGLCLCTLLACSGGDQGGNNKNNGGNNGGANNGSGTLDVSSTARIGRQGGVVAIRDADDPFYGANVYVQPGAVETATDFSIATVEPPPQNAELVMGVSPVVEVRPTTETGDLEITIPHPTGLSKRDSTALGRFQNGNWIHWPGATRPDLGPGVSANFDFIETRSGGLFRLLPELFGTASWTNETSSTVTLRVVEGHTNIQDNEEFAAAPTVLDELETDVPAGESVVMKMVPGRYLIEIEDESGGVTNDVVIAERGGENGPLGIDAASRPEVTMTASTTSVKTGESVELSVDVSSGTVLQNWYWNRTGGGFSGTRTGTANGQTQYSITWNAPNTRGEYWVYFTIYDENGAFGQDEVLIEVTGTNKPPTIDAVSATPFEVGPGGASRSMASVGDPGVTLLEVSASDPDGDSLLYFWRHALPGNFYDVDTGAQLSFPDGMRYLSDTSTFSLYTKSSVLYMAPADGLWFSGFPLGFYLFVEVMASDLERQDIEFVVFKVTKNAEGASNNGGANNANNQNNGGGGVHASCKSDAQDICMNWIGDSYAQNDTGARSTCDTWQASYELDVSCPSSGAWGTCVYYEGETNEWWAVYYGDSTDSAAMEDCTNSGIGIWRTGYTPP